MIQITRTNDSLIISELYNMIKKSQVEEKSEVKKQFIIPNKRIEWLDKRISQLNKFIDSINKKGIAFGADTLKPIKYTVIGDENVLINKTTGLYGKAKKIEIEGDTPKIKGWVFVASILPMTLEDGSQTNIIKTVPNRGPIPETFRTEIPTCEYCNQKRRRNETYVIKNDKGEFKQIGRNCLAKFLNTTSPESLADLASMFSDLFDTLESMNPGESEWGEEGKYEHAIGLGTFVTNSIAIIRSEGWLSRSKIQLGIGTGLATADNVWWFSTEPEKWRQEKAKSKTRSLFKDIEVRPEDEELAQKAIEWARELKKQAPESLSDYLWNLSIAVSQPVVTKKTSGIVASLVNAYQRATNKIDTSQTGKQIFFRGKITSKKPTKTGSTLWEFTNDAGEVVIWFDNKHEFDENLNNSLKENQPVQFEGTLQKISSYNGKEQKQVILKRFLSDVEFFEEQKKAGEEQKILEKKKESAPVLSPKQKVRMKLTVYDVKTTEGFTGGVVNIYRMVDEYGRKFFWKTSSKQELQNGMTYEADTVVGWEKQPGKNIPVLDEKGERKLAYDKYDQAAIKLESVHPLSVEGKELVSRDEIKEKVTEIKKVKKIIEKIDSEIQEIINKIDEIQKDSVAIISYNGEINPDNVKLAQELIAELEPEIQRANTEKINGKNEFIPRELSSGKMYTSLYRKLQDEQKRPVGKEEAVQIYEKLLPETKQIISRILNHYVPLMKEELKLSKSYQEGKEISYTNPSYSHLEKEICIKLVQIIKNLELEIESKKTMLMDNIFDLRRAEDKFSQYKRPTYDQANYYIGSIEDAANRILSSLEEKLNRLKSQPSGFDWQQQFSWERDIWIPKETKHPFTPDRFIEFATNAINATNNSIKLIPEYASQINDLRQKEKQERETLEKLESDKHFMVEERERGVAKKTSSWILRNCKFAVIR